MLGINGGLIGLVRNPTNTSAPGVWLLREQELKVRDRFWPGTEADIEYTIANSGGEFQLRDTGTVNYDVDWGDGSAIETVTTNNKSHTYASSGTYTVKLDITGSYRPYWNSNAFGDQVLIVSIESGVDLGTELLRAFAGMDALVELTIPSATTNNVTNMASMFAGMNYLRSYPSMDTSSTTDANSMFSGYGNPTPAFTGTVPLYDFSEVTNASQLFRDNQFITSLPAFNLSKTTTLNNAFRGCTNLASMPAITITSLCTNFNSTWAYTPFGTTFPIIDTSGGTNFAFTWLTSSSNSYSALTTFPALDFSNATTFYAAWNNQRLLANFPAGRFDSTGTLANNAFQSAFNNCALTATSIANILASLVQNGASGITLHIGGGTNAAYSTWSTDAQNDLATLQADGWNVTYNS